MAKRYLLFFADADLSEEDMKSLEALVRRRYGVAKAISVKANARAAIVKTSNVAAAGIRESGGELKVGGKSLGSVLTSGAIGKLKRRATGAAANGKVPE